MGKPSKKGFYKDSGKVLKLHAGLLKCSRVATRCLRRILGPGEKLAGPDWVEAAASWQLIGSTVARGYLLRHKPGITW